MNDYMNKLELIAALEVEKGDLKRRLNSLEDTILTLKQSINFDTLSSHRNGSDVEKQQNTTAYDKYKGYYEAKGNKERAIAILKAEGKFLHMRQIVKIAQSLEPTKNPDVVKGKIQQGVYALGNLENAPIINKVIGASKTNAFWGSKNWVDEKGEIKPEYMYDQDEVSSRKSETLEI
jgi:hypothetical protein